MRDLPKARYRATSACKSQVSVHRSGDVTSFNCGRIHAQGDTRNAEGRLLHKRRPIKEWLGNIPVAGRKLTEEEAAKWAVKMRYGFKKK